MRFNLMDWIKLPNHSNIYRRFVICSLIQYEIWFIDLNLKYEPIWNLRWWIRLNCPLPKLTTYKQGRHLLTFMYLAVSGNLYLDNWKLLKTYKLCLFWLKSNLGNCEKWFLIIIISCLHFALVSWFCLTKI